MKTEVIISKDFAGNPIALTKNRIKLNNPVDCVACSEPLINFTGICKSEDSDKDFFTEELDYEVTLAVICPTCRVCQNVVIQHTQITEHKIEG